MPLDIGMSTSARIISISGPSAFRASITCLADLTEVTEEQNKHRMSVIFDCDNNMNEDRTLETSGSLLQHEIGQKPLKGPRAWSSKGNYTHILQK